MNEEKLKIKLGLLVLDAIKEQQSAENEGITLEEKSTEFDYGGSLHVKIIVSTI